MKKKIIFAVATGFFAVATMFNLNMLQSNKAGDVSLDAISVMAQAQSESGTSLSCLYCGGDGVSPGGSSCTYCGGWDRNNSNMGGLFNYPDKAGSPKFCTLYAKVDVYGKIVSTSEAPIGQVQAGYSVTQVTGVKERCPRKGNGCTVYSCQKTN